MESRLMTSWSPPVKSETAARQGLVVLAARELAPVALVWSSLWQLLRQLLLGLLRGMGVLAGVVASREEGSVPSGPDLVLASVAATLLMLQRQQYLSAAPPVAGVWGRVAGPLAYPRAAPRRVVAMGGVCLCGHGLVVPRRGLSCQS